MYKKILVIATRRIGDVLLTTPLFHALRKAYPTAQLDVIVFKGTEKILEGNADISNIIGTSAKPDWSEYKTILSRIWHKYDLSISTLAGDRPSFYAFLGSKNRVSAQHFILFKHAWKRWLFTKWVKLDDQLWHVVLQNNQFAEILDIEGSTTVVVPQSEGASRKLATLLGFDIAKIPYCVIHPYPMWKYKQLDDSVWTDIGKYFLDKGYRVVISGGPATSEVAKCEMLARSIQGAVSLAGKTQFSDTSELLNNARIYIGPDTSITHLAAACGTPTLAIFGPTSPVRWGPWPKNYTMPKTEEKMYSPYEKVREMQNLGNVWLYQSPSRKKCIPCQGEGCDNHLNSKSLCLTEISSNTLIKCLSAMGIS